MYHSLVQSQNVAVKQTLALSLHEVARILGSKLVEEELVAVFEELIQVCVVVMVLKIKLVSPKLVIRMNGWLIIQHLCAQVTVVLYILMMCEFLCVLSLISLGRGDSKNGNY